MPVSRSLCREHLVPGPAHEPITTSCEIAWLDGSHSAQEEHLLQLRKHTCRALSGVRRSLSREGPAQGAETGTITHSCANAWRARFADLDVALMETRPRPGCKSGRAGYGCESGPLPGLPAMRS